jgi:hypothetical protein
VGIDRESREVAALEHLAYRLLGVVVHHAARGIELALGEHVHGAQRAPMLVAMRRVYHDRQVELLGEIDL